MLIRESFKDGSLALLVENLKNFIPNTKYLRLKSLLSDTNFSIESKVTDLIRLVIIKWASGVYWCTELEASDANIAKALRDSNFTKL